MDTPLWYRVFSEREVKEIQLALNYKELLNHGTSGHLEYTVIAKFAKLIEFLNPRNVDDTPLDGVELKNYLETLFGGK